MSVSALSLLIGNPTTLRLNGISSHVALMVVLEALVDMVTRERGTEAQKHIAAVERQNHILNEYWQENLATNKGELNYE